MAMNKYLSGEWVIDGATSESAATNEIAGMVSRPA
jgi:hypothetical protein